MSTVPIDNAKMLEIVGKYGKFARQANEVVKLVGVDPDSRGEPRSL